MSDGTFHGKQDCPHGTGETVQAVGRRKYRRKADGICARCRNEPRRQGQSYGLKCHAAVEKEWRDKQKQIREAERAELARLRAQQQEQGQEHGQGHSQAG